MFRVILGILCGVNEIRALQAFYARYSNRLLQILRGKLWVASSRVKQYKLTLEEGADRLSLNVCKELRIQAA
jgi:hypothetical protein